MVVAGCKGAYENVTGAYGPIRHSFTKTQGKCSFLARSKGVEFKATAVLTRPQRCTYMYVITVAHLGEVQYRDTDTIRTC